MRHPTKGGCVCRVVDSLTDAVPGEEMSDLSGLRCPSAHERLAEQNWELLAGVGGAGQGQWTESVEFF